MLLTTFLVDDDGNGDFTSVQAAIDAAMADDEILVNGGADGLHTEAGILVNKDVTIRGLNDAQAPQVIVQAGLEPGLAFDRVFLIESETTVTIDNMTIRYGNASNFSADISGGGILNFGTLAITNSTITENSAALDGGGVMNGSNSAILAIHNSTISNNTATGTGGGIANRFFSEGPSLSQIDPTQLSPGTVQISESTVMHNSASTYGGGISLVNTVLDVIHSTVSHNTVTGNGGGIAVLAGSLDVSGSTISQNSASGRGGGIYHEEDPMFPTGMTISDSTVSDNTAAGDGGGLAKLQGTGTISNSMITGNLALGGPSATGSGGGIYSTGSLTITGGIINQNSAAVDGGGLFNNDGALAIHGVTIAGNTSNDDGGGLANFRITSVVILQEVDQINLNVVAEDLSSGTVHISESTIADNSSANAGGGISNVDGTVEILASTISGNSAQANGGGIHNIPGGLNVGGSVFVTNSTISGNTADGDGGGIYNSSDVVITNSTIVLNIADADGNESGSGGGIFTFDAESSPSTQLFNTIVAGNTLAIESFPNDIAGEDVDSNSAYNLIGDPDSAGGLNHGVNGNIVGQDGGDGQVLLDLSDILDPILADNGGPTLTHNLVSGSPAIDAGNNDLAVDPGPDGMVGTDDDIPLETDQRGFDRIVDISQVPNAAGGVDIGAVEFDLAFFDIVALDANKPEGDSGTTTFTFLVTRSGNTSGAAALDFSVVGVQADAADFAGGVLPSGTVQFADGETEQIIEVNVQADLLVERDETFLVQLSNPSTGIITTATAGGTIINDDTALISISDASANESDGVLSFTVTLSNPVAEAVTVDVTTVDVTATSQAGSGQDYVPLIPPIRLTFLPGGPLTQTIDVTVINDNIVEPDETFEVHLSNPLFDGEPDSTRVVISDDLGIGTILNDDTATISISDASAFESDGVLRFTVTLSNPVAEDVRVDLRTVDITATSLFGAGQDYIPLPPDFFVTLPAGVQTVTFDVRINDDLNLEPNETFEVRISDVRIGEGPMPPQVDGEFDPRVTVGDGIGIGAILNDENIEVFGAGSGIGIQSMPPQVIVKQSETGEVLHSFLAYDAAFRGGVRVAAGDVNGDGVADIITAAGVGGGPHIRVFDGLSGQVIANFFAYDPGFTGGVFVAAGDVNGDGHADIITGAGAGGGPHVKVFDGLTLLELHSFFAYGEGFIGGVSVAAGDVNHDGLAEFITAAGPGGGPHVRVFDGATAQSIADFFAYDPAFAGGVTVAAGDVNGDGFAEVVTGAGTGGGPHVRIFDGRDLPVVLSEFFAFDANVTAGLFVGTTDVNSDGLAEILVGTGPGRSSEVRIFSASGELIGSSTVFNPHFRSGVHAGGSLTPPPIAEPVIQPAGEDQDFSSGGAGFTSGGAGFSSGGAGFSSGGAEFLFDDSFFDALLERSVGDFDPLISESGS